jgi:hypothetical protein
MDVRLFLSQALLDTWLEEGKADLAPGGLRLVEEGRDVALEGACHFVSLLEGGDDAGWLAKVKTERQIKERGGELWGDSVLLDQSAYEVVPGFVAIASPPDRG